jgi:hypothetical protein
VSRSELVGERNVHDGYNNVTNISEMTLIMQIFSTMKM